MKRGTTTGSVGNTCYKQEATIQVRMLKIGSPVQRNRKYYMKDNVIEFLGYPSLHFPGIGFGTLPVL
jgi:hypothetical protein